jgi:hypothetical protein
VRLASPFNVSVVHRTVCIIKKKNSHLSPVSDVSGLGGRGIYVRTLADCDWAQR